MKVATSYFYQLRFFEPYMVPLSTAIWDPKWYHEFQGQDHNFIDKRGVINGLRVPAMAPGKATEGTCQGTENPGRGCQLDPSKCLFLQLYRQQLDALDCVDYMRRVRNLCSRVQETLGFSEEPVAVFMVHEPYTKSCSERSTIQQWLTSNGFPCTELDYSIKGHPTWVLPV